MAPYIGRVSLTQISATQIPIKSNHLGSKDPTSLQPTPFSLSPNQNLVLETIYKQSTVSGPCAHTSHKTAEMSHFKFDKP